MKLKKEIRNNLFRWIIFAGCLACYGKTTAQVLPEYSAFPKQSLGIQAGTQGLGIQYTKSFLPAFSARIGLNTVPGITMQYNNRDLKLSRTSVYAIVDWQPLYGGTNWLARKWYVSAGISHYFNNTLYREGIGKTPDYYIYMSRLRPYVGTGLGNIELFNNLYLRTDFGFFIPTSAATSTYSNKAEKVSTGLKGLLPGMNAGVTIYFKF